MQRSKDGNDFIVDVLVGISDGLIIPFGLVIGLSSFFSTTVIVAVTLSVTILSALAMALSRYFSAKESLKDDPVPQIVSSLNLRRDTESLIVEEAGKTNQEWQTIMKEINETSRSVKSARNIAASYVSAGLIPVIPFIIATNVAQGIRWSLGISLLALFLFGFLKGKLTGQNPWAQSLQSLFTGLFVAVVALIVGRVFN